MDVQFLHAFDTVAAVCVLVHSWFYLLLLIYALLPRYIIMYKAEYLLYFVSSRHWILPVVCCFVHWIVTYTIHQLTF